MAETTQIRYSLQNFNIVKILGKGAFGKICLVREKTTNEVYAMKAQSKSFLIEEDQIDNIKAEREILATAKNEWIIKLEYSFQDEKFIYEVLEYCPGGDFYALLVRQDKLSEEHTRFYISELCEAIACVHEHGFSHRDVKPDNLLIDREGHLKLSDFGLSKKVKRDMYSNFAKSLSTESVTTPGGTRSEPRLKIHARRRRNLMNSLVGTPDYVAIEILKNSGYDKTVDWWSVGVIFYECLMGYPPFYAEDVNTVCQKIVNYAKELEIPKNVTVSDNARNLIFSLITVPEHRLSFAEIKNHKFFESVPWGQLRSMKPPFVPQIDDIEDTKYFDLEDEDKEDIKKDPEEIFKLNEYQPRTVASNDTTFQGFTYIRPKEVKRAGLDGIFEEIADSEEVIKETAEAPHEENKSHVTEGGIEIFGATGVNKELINGKFLPHKTLKHEGVTVWKRMSLALVLWYWKKRAVWMLTRERDLGTDRVYCVVRCDSTNPIEIDSSFFIWNPHVKKLIPDADVRVRQFSLEIFE